MSRVPLVITSTLNLITKHSLPKNRIKFNLKLFSLLNTCHSYVLRSIVRRNDYISSQECDVEMK